MIRLFYNLLWPVGLFCFLPGYLLKMFRRGGYRRHFGQRFAFYDAATRGRLTQRPAIWLHAVSVGEVAVALKLANAIRAFQPGSQLVLTTTTTTGFAFAERNALAGMEVMYTPLDFWPIMRRAFAAIKPQKIVLMEAEIWPNLAAEARARKIPLALVNARLSPRSERRFRRFRWAVAPVFGLLDLVCVPEIIDVDRWAALGVQRERIRHTGSIKYDPAETEQAGQSQTRALPSVFNPDQLVLFGGSTHRGEEEILARIFLRLRQKFPQLLLFLAPRHVERVREVKKQIEKLSLGVKLCSEIGTRSDAHDCLLLDRTGELRKWYVFASVVFIGKSLTAIGGQNPVEPIVAGKPVVFGPHMENFATLATGLVAAGGAVQVGDEKSLERALANLLQDGGLRARLVRDAARVIDSHRGATRRTAELIFGLN